MNVSLTKELARFVEDEVKEGEYASASEVVRDGLRLLLHEKAVRAEKLAVLRQAIEVGLDDVRAGRVSDTTATEIARELQGKKRRGRRRSGAT